jgi:hypothetical protein
VSFNIQGAADATGGFMGHTVGYQYLFPTNTNVLLNKDITVGAGTEGDMYGNYAVLNFSDNQISVDFSGGATWSTASFNGFHVVDSQNQLSNITNVTLDSTSNMVGLVGSRVTFDSNNIWVNWNGLSFNPNTLVVLDVTFA